MICLGTILNCSGIVLGGFLGLIFGKFLKDNYKEMLMLIIGISSVFIGISGTLKEMIEVKGGKFVISGVMFIIVSLSIGSIIGEAINIEKKFAQFGEWLKHKVGGSGDEKFVDAYILSTLTIALGAMGVLGSIQEGALGDVTMLSAKAIIDGIIILIMSASIGKGSMFSAISVAVVQVPMTLLAGFLAPVMTDVVISGISMIGSIIIFCVSANIVWNKIFRAGNMFPSMLVGGFLAYFFGLF